MSGFSEFEVLKRGSGRRGQEERRYANGWGEGILLI